MSLSSNTLVIRQLVEQVKIRQGSIEILIDARQLAYALHPKLPPSAPGHVTIRVDAALKRSGRAMRLLQENGRGSGSTEPQEHLVRLLVRARSWWNLAI
jgi:site-specific DNA recombinase